MSMNTKIRVDTRALLAMSREEAIAYYMREVGATEAEARSLVSSTHPAFRDVVAPATAQRREQPHSPKVGRRVGLRH